jgi:hypothetical protein
MPATDLTDRELVLELCKRLGLTMSNQPARTPIDPVANPEIAYLMARTPEVPDDDEYSESLSDIILGCGNGYGGFFVRFSFKGDKLTSHTVAE